MKTIIIVALASLASTTGLISSVQAQSNPKPEDFTRSGDSLEGIESRTVEGDYRSFFGQEATGRNTGRNNRETFELSRKKGRGLLQLNDDLQFVINRSTPQPINATPFRNSERSIDGQRVEVKLDLDQ